MTDDLQERVMVMVEVGTMAECVGAVADIS